MRTIPALVALVLSSLSLGLQIAKTRSPAPLDKFMVPARLSELDRRTERADVRMLRDSIVMRDGIGVPFIREITSDHRHIVVRLLVSEDHLPQGYEDRKKVLRETALAAVGSVASEFDLKLTDNSAFEVVAIQFLRINDLVKNSDKVYAEFRNAELTFH